MALDGIAFSVPKDKWDAPNAEEVKSLANLARRAERQGGHNGILPARRVAVGPRAAELNSLGLGGASAAVADPIGQPVVFSGLAKDWLIRQRGHYEMMRRIGAVRMKLRPCSSVASARGPGPNPEEEISVHEFFGERSPSVGQYTLYENSWHRVHRALRGGYEVPDELAHMNECPLFSAGRRGAGAGFQRHSESWMAQAFGRKVWLLIPAHHPRPTTPHAWWRMLPFSEARGPRCGFFTCAKRSVRGAPMKSAMLSDPPEAGLSKEMRMTLPADARICLTHAGDVVFIPRGWWHASLNIDDFSVGIGWMGSIRGGWDEPMQAVLAGDLDPLKDWCALQSDLPSQARASPLNALRLAAEAGDVAALEVLMNSPGGKEIIANGETGDIVAAAARTGQVEILDLLLHAGIDVVNCVDLAGGSTALHWAARCGHIRVASWLIQQKANLDPIDIYGRPLHYAAYYGHVEIITLLIGSKVSIDGGVVFERTPALDSDEAMNGPLAKKHGVNGVKNAMRRCGDHPGDWDAFEVVRPKPFAASGKLKESSSLQLAQRRTPLHLASAQGHIAVCVALLRANANANIIDKWGLDAFTYAEAAGHKTAAVQVAQAAASALEGSSSEDDNSDIESSWKPEPEPEMAPN